MTWIALCHETHYMVQHVKLHYPMKGSLLHCFLLYFFSLLVMSFIWCRVRVRLWIRLAFTSFFPIRKVFLYRITHMGNLVQNSILSSSCQLFAKNSSSLAISWLAPPFLSISIALS